MKRTVFLVLATLCMRMCSGNKSCARQCNACNLGASHVLVCLLKCDDLLSSRSVWDECRRTLSAMSLDKRYGGFMSKNKGWKGWRVQDDYLRVRSAEEETQEAQESTMGLTWPSVEDEKGGRALTLQRIWQGIQHRTDESAQPEKEDEQEVDEGSDSHLEKRYGGFMRRVGRPGKEKTHTVDEAMLNHYLTLLTEGHLTNLDQVILKDLLST
uniref:proenkephalin-A-like n=1 Tax=Myxine glutinosa TaxID=7769 RepID=UPI00358F24EC